MGTTTGERKLAASMALSLAFGLWWYAFGPGVPFHVWAGSVFDRTDAALAGFVECAAGPVELVDESCDWSDVNNDGHVDLLDFRYL